jgi:hypothetical protein
MQRTWGFLPLQRVLVTVREPEMALRRLLPLALPWVQKAA